MASKPRIKPPDWTQAPNVFFDSILPGLTGAECKVCNIVIRETFGWHLKTTNKHELSLSYLAKATGLNRDTVKVAVGSLTSESNDREAILGRKKRAGGSYSYYLLMDTSEVGNLTGRKIRLAENSEVGGKSARQVGGKSARQVGGKSARPHVLERNMKENNFSTSSVPTEKQELVTRDDGKNSLDAQVKDGAAVIRWFEELSNGNTWKWTRDGGAFDAVKHLPGWAILFGICKSIQKCPEHRLGSFSYCIGAIVEAHESDMRKMDPDTAMQIAQAERRKAKACIRLGKWKVPEMTDEEFKSVMRESRAGD